MKRQIETAQHASKKKKSLERKKELGIIDSVCFRNFMCHDNLKFQFDPHINFIIGQNGSGKSAILTGIILALGGKSSATGRYSNIKGFIKTGKQKAYLSVTLKNCGDFAYKQDVYGEKITIEREITVEGGSVYKIKSEQGHIVSNLKEEVTNVLNAMDIQIDNPVVVLTQETSRNFLMSKHGKEEKLYDFFYRGTGLQVLEENYQITKCTEEATKKDLISKKQALPEMEKELKRWKRLIDSSSKITDLKNERMWANVRDIEALVQQKKIKEEEIHKTISDTKKESERCKNAYDAVCLQLEQHMKERTECDTKMAAQRKTLSELNSLRDSTSDTLRKCQGMLERHRREEDKLLNDIAMLNKSIQENNDKNQNDIDEQRRERDIEIQNLEAENANAIDQQEILKKEREKLMQKQNDVQHAMESLNTEINSFDYKKKSLQKDLSQLKSGMKNRQVLFGEHTTAILAEIEYKSSQFIKKPKGPIGLYIEVKDPKWNNAVETCLKPNMLRSFCCDNSQDSTLLSQILKKYYTSFMPSVIVSKFLPHVHDVSFHKAQSNFPTVFDMLKINDPVIANCLIDQVGIENVVLIEDITIAQPIMLNNPPRNCKLAFLLNCDEIKLNPYRNFSATTKSTNILQSVDQTRIRVVEVEYSNIVGEIQKRRNNLSELKTTFHKYPEKIRKVEEEFVKFTHLTNRNSRRINDLKQFEDPKDVSGMLEELVTFKNDLERKQHERNQSEQALSNCKTEFHEICKKLQNQKELVQEEKAKFDELGKEVCTYGQKKESFASKIKEYASKLKKAESDLRVLVTELRVEQEKTQENRKEAEKTCPCVLTERSMEEINAQLQAMVKVIHEQSQCNRQDLVNKYNEKSKRWEDAKQELKNIEGYQKKIKNMLHTREVKLKGIIKHTQHCLDLAFAVVLKGNGFTGRIDFTKEHALRLEATPRQEHAEAAGQKSCSSLSGGERSFVTISFLLALWDRIEMPFRILDEYDVFMDSNNRHLSVNLLIRRAHFIENTQFIFLSPLELPDMPNSEKIKVHKMPAPKRMGLSNMEESNMEDTNE